MPLASTLSLLWITGVCYFCPQSQRLIGRCIRIIAVQDGTLRNTIAYAFGFFSSPAGALPVPSPPGGASARQSPANQLNLLSRSNRLIIRDDGDICLPNGRKIHGIGENLECAICYCSLKESPDGPAPAVKVLECSHAFHSQCIADWYQREKHCPTCRDTSSSLRNLRDFFFT
jgi:hypothetical protein